LLLLKNIFISNYIYLLFINKSLLIIFFITLAMLAFEIISCEKVIFIKFKMKFDNLTSISDSNIISIKLKIRYTK